MTVPQAAADEPMPPRKGPLRLVISFATEDSALAQVLASHLAPLKQAGTLTLWKTDDIPAGHDRKQTITRKLESADVIVPLLSHFYLSSEECYSAQLGNPERCPWLKSTLLIPVIVRACAWESVSLFESLQVLPKDHKPVAQHLNEDQDTVWRKVVDGIQRAIGDWHNPRPTPVPIVVPPVPVDQGRSVLATAATVVSSVMSVVLIADLLYARSGLTAHLALALAAGLVLPVTIVLIVRRRIFRGRSYAYAFRRSLLLRGAGSVPWPVVALAGSIVGVGLLPWHPWAPPLGISVPEVSICDGPTTCDKKKVNGDMIRATYSDPARLIDIVPDVRTWDTSRVLEPLFEPGTGVQVLLQSDKTRARVKIAPIRQEVYLFVTLVAEGRSFFRPEKKTIPITVGFRRDPHAK